MAATMTLEELVSGGSITSGDKKFDEFGYEWDGDMPPPDRVNVVTIEDSQGNFGIQFQGGFLDLAGGSSSAATITYRVSPTSSGLFISDAHLEGNPEVVGTGGDGYRAVDYDKITPVLVEAIKEQQQILDDTKKELDTLKERLASLEFEAAQ